jgi:hypothetical protein
MRESVATLRMTRAGTLTLLTLLSLGLSGCSSSTDSTPSGGGETTPVVTSSKPLPSPAPTPAPAPADTGPTPLPGSTESSTNATGPLGGVGKP